MRILLTTILILVTSIIYAQCPCEKKSPISEIGNFDSVLIVELISKSKNSKKFDKNQDIKKGLINSFKIHTVIKGDLEIYDTIKCITGNGISDDGLIFNFGELYILFYEEYIDKCSPTIKFKNDIYTQIIKKINPNSAPPAPPVHPSVKWSSKLNKFEFENRFSELRAEILNEDIDYILSELQKLISLQKQIPINSLIQIHLDSNNKIINQRIISSGQKSTQMKLEDKLRKFIENEIIFITDGQDCLIEGTQWIYRYE
jgi:hypothetical protein